METTTGTGREKLRGCGWVTTSLSREAMTRVRAEAARAHPDATFLTSCQRIEAYGELECNCNAERRWSGAGVVRHLAEVAAGIESIVLGETQVMGQVRSAFAEAEGALADAAETAIASARELRRAVNYESHAGHLLDRGLAVAGIAASGSLLVVGTGQMGQLVAQRGAETGFDEVTVVGRKARGPEFAFRPIAELGLMEPVDVVVGCLGDAADEIALAALPAAKLVIDLGTPRNFGGEAPEPVVTMVEMFSAGDARHSKKRRGELAEQLAAIVEQRLNARAETGTSDVGRMRQAVERLRAEEAERMAARHPEIAAEAIEAMTRALANRLLHGPTERLRAEDDPTVAARIASLFD